MDWLETWLAKPRPETSDLKWRYTRERCKHDPKFAAHVLRLFAEPEPVNEGAHTAPPMTPAQRVNASVVVCMLKAEGWLEVHCHRAERRGLDTGRDVLSRALCLIGTMRTSTELRGKVSRTTGRLVVSLYRCVLMIADMEARDCAHAINQRDELEESGLWSAVHAISEVTKVAVAHRTGRMDDQTAVDVAAELSGSVRTVESSYEPA
jgi:hypothetical protein